MIRFRDVLNRDDRDHLHRILKADGRVPGQETRTAKVEEFLRDDTWLADEALGAFKGLDQRERERLISELIWRVECRVEGSITRVMGVNSYPLGYGFMAVESTQDGREIYCLLKTGA